LSNNGRIKIDDLHPNLQTDINGKAKQIDLDTTNTTLQNLDNTIDEHLADTMTYSVLKSNLDSNGIYTTVKHKRSDGTLILNSVLSGGTSPSYTTRTETYYKADGTTPDKTIVYSITYDANGMVVSEVMQ
jgi:hypothetical protein